MKQKILVMGGVAGGASVAARLRRLSEDNQIIMFEKGMHVSFSNCSLPYHLSGAVPKIESLIMMSPEKFAKQYHIDARTQHEVVAIDRQHKTVTVRDHAANQTYTENYDILVLSPGALPIVPPIQQMESIPTFTIRNVTDIAQLKQHMRTDNIRHITVIGGGYIGIETVENLKHAGYEVALIEAGSQILRTLDADMVPILHTELHQQGVQLLLNEKVVAYEGKTIVCASGQRLSTDLVVMAIGVRPDVALAQAAGIELGASGGIKVNPHFQTNDPCVYAVGDAVEVIGDLYHQPFLLSLAGPAQKQARYVANHIHDIPSEPLRFTGSSVLRVFNYHAAATGLSEGFIQAKKMDIQYQTVLLMPMDKVSLMPGAQPMYLKLLYEINTKRIIGAQAIGKGNVDKRIDVIATVIKFKGTIYDLSELDLCYAPPFGTAKDAVNYAAYIAQNLAQKAFQQIHPLEVRGLLEKNAYILDVRESAEYNVGHLIGAHHIPLSTLRENLALIPRDQPIYIHCRSGQRSYNACLLLQQHGFSEVYNIAGGFSYICALEYYQDQTSGRAPIVSQYYF